MARHWFSPPVHIQTERVGSSFAVTNVERAAEYLLSWREHGDCPIWREAVATCMAAIQNRAPVEDARATFVAAAKRWDKLA